MGSRGGATPQLLGLRSEASQVRLPGDRPSDVVLASLANDSSATIEALFPSHNRYIRQIQSAVKSKSSPFAKLQQQQIPKQALRSSAGQKIEDGFLSEAIERYA